MNRILGWLRKRFSLFNDSLTILDLMRLASDESCKWNEFVHKVYEWEHERRIEIGKWFLALSAALPTAVLAILARSSTTPSISAELITGIIGVSGVFAAAGILTILSARTISAQLARTTTLVANFATIRVFIARVLREDG